MCGLVTWQFRQRFTRHKSGLKVSCATDLSEGSDTNSRGVTGGGPGGGGGETFPHMITSCKSSKLSSRAYQASGAEHTWFVKCQCSCNNPLKQCSKHVAEVLQCSKGLVKEWAPQLGQTPHALLRRAHHCSCALSLSLQTHLFQDSVSPRDLYSVRTAASLPPSAVLHTFQKWSQWVDLALRLWKSKRHFSCFWHEKDNVGHRTLLANFDHEQVPCVSGSQQTNASWSFFNNSFWDSVKSKCFPVGSAAIFLRFLHAFVFCITSLAMFFFLSGCVCILFNSSQNLVVGIPIFLISEFSHIFNIPRVGIKNSNISKFLRDSKSFMMHVSIFWFRDPKA